jgi:uncharacterized membrane protein
MSSALAARRSPTRGYLFGLSVALNVFLVALIAAHLVRPSLAPAAPPRGGGPLGRLIAQLPPDEADKVRAVLDRERPSYQAARDKVSAAHREVGAAIGRTPYDEAAVRSALADWQASWHEFSTRFNLVFLDAVRTLSDQGRARLADAARAEDARHRQAE